jgi:hypothetical protein
MVLNQKPSQSTALFPTKLKGAMTLSELFLDLPIELQFMIIKRLDYISSFALSLTSRGYRKLVKAAAASMTLSEKLYLIFTVENQLEE